MKKLFLALSSVALVLSLGACTSKKSEASSASGSGSASGSASQSQSQSQSESSSSQGGGTGDKIYFDLGNAAEYWQGKYDEHPVENNGFFAYFFTGTSPVGPAWPGSQLELVSGTVYSVDKQDATNVIFNVNSWGGDCQTEDLTLPTDGKNLFTIETNNQDGTNQAGSWSVYAA